MKEAEKASHTPEPWRVLDYHMREIGYSHNCTVARMLNPPVGHSDANARRIVACVNACEGMDDPQTVIKRLRCAAVDAACKYAELEQQRDELDALLAEFALLASAIATDGAEPDHRREYAKHLANRAESIAKHRGKQ